MSRRRRKTNSSPLVPSAISQIRSLTPLLRDVVEPVDYPLIEDRRSYHPEGPFRPARTIGGHPSKPLQVKNKARPFLAHGLKFSAPKSVLLCVRRKTRKEVLFAKRLTSKGAGARRRRRNWFSKIGC